MAVHTITLSTEDEANYAKYIALATITEAQAMNWLKGILNDQVVQRIKDEGHTKFDGLSTADKLTLLGA